MASCRLAALALLVVTMLAISGCGGGSSSTSSTSSNAAATNGGSNSGADTTSTASQEASKDAGANESASHSLTRAELITKGDAICARVNAKITANPARTTQDIIRLTPQLAAYEEASANELGKLVAPASLTSDWERIVADAKALAENTRQLGQFVAKDNTSAARYNLGTTAVIQRRMLATAKRDGFHQCSLPG